MKCPDPIGCEDCGTHDNLTHDDKMNTLCVTCYKERRRKKVLCKNCGKIRAISFDVMCSCPDSPLLK